MVARSGTIESFIFLASYDRMYQSLRENENKWTVDGRVVKFSTVGFPLFKNVYYYFLLKTAEMSCERVSRLAASRQR
jgi:hypothetical protein